MAVTHLRRGRNAEMWGNAPERECWQRLEEKGWKVSRRGWPDFMAWRRGQLVAIEVKPNAGHRLKRAQWKILASLAAHGIASYLWSPDAGFTRITGTPKQAAELTHPRRRADIATPSETVRSPKALVTPLRRPMTATQRHASL